MLPSLSTQRRYYQAGERGKTHVFNVLAVSFVRRSARLWPGNYPVIHCMPGSGSLWLWSARELTALCTPCHVGSDHSRVVELTCCGLSAEKEKGDTKAFLGQYFATIHDMDDGFGSAGSCREYTSLRSDEQFFTERMDSWQYENWPSVVGQGYVSIVSRWN